MKKYDVSHNMPLSIELGGRFRELHFCMQNKLNQELKVLDLTHEQLRLLKTVCDNPGCDQNFLAQSTERGKSAMTRIINTMVDNNLIRREQSSADARSNLIYPTKHGSEMTIHGIKILRRFTEELFGSDEDELIKLMTMANKFIARLKR
ncbi:MarR family transcriptional regulator [Puteibacter caeruleilacunae]|nr:MarR family transcriptional regulator [Puteibacter caeruleilacunae]